jgi:hypoxanthine-guanine phosphoribosyltransferase
MNKELKRKLLILTDIFDKGYTVTITNGAINQYSNVKKPYIVSHKTLIKITNDTLTVLPFDFKPDKTYVVGYWLDSDKTKWVELNETFSDKAKALLFAKKHNQQCIYDINTGGTIDV